MDRPDQPRETTQSQKIDAALRGLRIARRELSRIGEEDEVSHINIVLRRLEAQWDEAVTAEEGPEPEVTR